MIRQHKKKKNKKTKNKKKLGEIFLQGRFVLG